MARSSYIYLVVGGIVPIAAFTVKHECLSWLERCKVASPGADSWRVFRFRDGHGDAGYQVLDEAK
jgi:hypothetical protein